MITFTAKLPLLKPQSKALNFKLCRFYTMYCKSLWIKSSVENNVVALYNIFTFTVWGQGKIQTHVL